MKKNLLLLFLSLTCIGPLYAEDLSDRLPVELVRRLMQKGLWNNQLDQENSDLAQEYLKFWKGLSTPEINDGDEICDLLFTDNSTEKIRPQNGRLQVPSTNPLKVETLRFAKTYFHGPSLDKVLAIEQSWINRSTKLVLDIIKMTSIPDLLEVATPFENKIKAKQIFLFDLSPEKRNELSQTVSQDHGISILEKNKNGHYRVTGIYHDQRKLFGIDFGRSLDEILISFVHEMVHAADPVIEKHRQKYKELYPEVVDILVKYSGSAQVANLIDKDLLQYLFMEDDLKLLEEAANSALERRMQNLDQKLTGKKMKDTDASKLREWMREGIGLTLENEYRAYGLSMVFYVALKERFHFILNDSKQYKNFLQQFIAGDHYFIINYSIQRNPFLLPRSRPFLNKIDDEEELNKIVTVIDQLEFFYLEEVQNFIKQMNQKFSQAIRTYQADDHLLPEWARAGGFNHPSNPYNILSARLTTAWVLRFKNYLQSLLVYFKSQNMPMINQSIGILDLSDSSMDDLVLAGVFYENSPYQNIPSDLKNALSTESIDYVDREKYFKTYKFIPDLVFSDLSPEERGVITSGPQVIRNILRIKLIRALRFLEESFPVWHSTLTTTQNFINQLATHNYDVSISEIRARELLHELRDSLQTAGHSVEEMRRMGILLSELGMSYHLATENNWRPISEAFFKKRNDIVTILDLMSIRSPSLRSAKQNLNHTIENLKTQLRPWAEKCDDESDPKGGFLFFKADKPDPKLYFWRNVGPFQLEGYGEFPLTMVCYQQSLYAVRQPGDYTNFMTTLIHKNTPISKIFLGSRFISLEPMKIPLED